MGRKYGLFAHCPSLWAAVSPQPTPKSEKVSGLFRKYSRFVEIIGRDAGSINDCRLKLAVRRCFSSPIESIRQLMRVSQKPYQFV
jgi:hypothetical protein